jgi:hypothetical protein
MALRSTQPLTEMGTRNIPGGEGRPARKADNLNAICEPIVYKNVWASTFRSPMGLHGPLQGYLYLYLPLYFNKFYRTISCTWNCGKLIDTKFSYALQKRQIKKERRNVRFLNDFEEIAAILWPPPQSLIVKIILFPN